MKKEFLYIVQSSLEPAKCKIGITDNPERRLKEYNSTTGQSKDNIYSYLFTCEVKNMRGIEQDIKNKFPHLREQRSREIYFYNDSLFDMYVDFIKSHPAFVKEIFVKEKKQIKVVKKTTPSLKERGMTQNALIQRAKKVDNDEFYTRYEDIEKEISMYPLEIWKDKCVFCNCDDAVGETRTEKDSSAFALFFIKNFMRLGLKKLICTHYAGPMDLFQSGSKGYVFTKDGVEELINAPKGYRGGFEEPLSLQILKDEADIVCTNPPFSKSIEYWDLIINSGKRFLIISNVANVITHSFIPYFKNKQVWAGYNRVDKYYNPKRQLVEASGHWYTNISIIDRPKAKHLKFVPLDEIPEKSKRIDDAGILSVSNCYIPTDYDRPFAVSSRPILNGLLEYGYELVQSVEYYPKFNGKKAFSRVLVQKIN